MSDVMSRIQEVFHDVFDDDGLEITRESNAKTVEAWDSLAHINLVIAIEKEFGIKFALGELEGLKDVGGMADLIEKKIA